MTISDPVPGSAFPRKIEIGATGDSVEFKLNQGIVSKVEGRAGGVELDLTVGSQHGQVRTVNGLIGGSSASQVLDADGRVTEVNGLGVKHEYRHTGVAAGLYLRHLEEAAKPGGIGGGEMGWILETNKAMNRAMEGMGGTIVKKYRVYEKAL